MTKLKTSPKFPAIHVTYEWNIIWPSVLAPLSIVMHNLGQHLIANSIVHGLKFNYVLRKCVVLLTVTKVEQLTADNNRGIFSKEDHAVKCCVSNGVDVRRPLEEICAPVLSDVVITIHTKPSVGVH